MALFTLVFDYRGGTYVRQVEADDPKAATNEWLRVGGHEQSSWLNAESTRTLRERLAEDAPCPVDGMRNVWCWTAVADDHLVVVHVILTENAIMRAG